MSDPTASLLSQNKSALPSIEIWYRWAFGRALYSASRTCRGHLCPGAPWPSCCPWCSILLYDPPLLLGLTLSSLLAVNSQGSLASCQFLFTSQPAWASEKRRRPGGVRNSREQETRKHPPPKVKTRALSLQTTDKDLQNEEILAAWLGHLSATSELTQSGCCFTNVSA